MRLSAFRLERYGPFEQLDLPLDPTPGRVNLIVAPNGYGKSVIRRSIGEFLFGIEARTPMTFRFGTERMRLLAEVAPNSTPDSTPDSTTLSLVRRKGNGNTLSRADGTEFPPDQTRRLLGGADETLFHELFGLDTHLLRSGGRDLIRSQGRLGQVLFAASGGMGRVRDLLVDLERKRDDLGRAATRHRSRPIWSALSQWEQAAADLRRTALRPDGWIALERQAAETSQHLQALLAEQDDETRERDRLRTIGACRPWLDRMHAAQRILADAADAPELDDGFEKRWRDALEDGVKSASAATAARTEWQSAQDTRAALRFDPAWIAAEIDITALADPRGLAMGAENDLPTVQRALDADRKRVADLRRDLGWHDSIALPPASVVKDAQRGLREHPGLAAAAAAARHQCAESDRQLAAATTELGSLPAQPNLAAAADLVALLRSDGDPATRLDAARAKLRDAATAFRTALAAIPDNPLNEAALGSTAAPSEARLTAAGTALNKAESAVERAELTHAARLASIKTERTKLTALQQKAELPPEGALAEARAARETLWQAFRQPAHDPSVAVAMDRAIRDADAVADALIDRGQELAQANALRDRLATLETERQQDADAVTSATATLTNAKAGLLAIARAAGCAADDLSTLRAFLGAREAAVSCRGARDAAAAALADLEARTTRLGTGLATALDIAMPDLAALASLIAEADRRIEADRNLSAQRKSLTEQIAKQRAAGASAAATAETADRALADWIAQWATTAAALARPDGEALATTADALTQLDDLRATERAADIGQRRIDDMQAAIARLRTRVARLSDLSPEIAAQPPIDAADAMQRRLRTEQQQAARCADADQRMEQAAVKLAFAGSAAEAAIRTRDGLRAALRADTDDEAERQLQRSRAVLAARTDITEALRQLAQQGGGLSVDALTARAAETTADADAARTSDIEAHHRTRGPLLESARDASTIAAAALDQAGGGLDAAEAAQRREAARAMLARTAEEALVLHATHALLQAALDRQAKTADQPLLDRIGEVLRTITGGVQAGVRIEDTRDGQTMVALEADGLTRKSLDQLSEGTSDQLYLALRIAALEDYAGAAAPLPFIADDVLQTFDDARTTATLRALLELSNRVQVIVLTHHPHVGDLAGRLANGAVQVMRLDA